MLRATGCLCVLVVMVVIVSAVPAEAQSPRSYWGVSGSFVPVWETNSDFKVVFDADELVLEGSELRIGFVRGRALAGEWGVSFVQRQIKEGSTVSLESLGSG